MSTTFVSTITSGGAHTPRYEYYYRDNHNDNKREVLLDDRAVDTFNEIPLVDISRIYSDNLADRMAVAKEMARVCKTVGFMYIKGHGISQDLIDDVFELSRRYHAQPSEIKMKEYVYNNKELRGYNEHYVNTPEGPVCTAAYHQFNGQANR